MQTDYLVSERTSYISKISSIIQTDNCPLLDFQIEQLPIGSNFFIVLFLRGGFGRSYDHIHWKKYFNYINDNTRHFTDIISSKKTKKKKSNIINSKWIQYNLFIVKYKSWIYYLNKLDIFLIQYNLSKYGTIKGCIYMHVYIYV